MDDTKPAAMAEKLAPDLSAANLAPDLSAANLALTAELVAKRQAALAQARLRAELAKIGREEELLAAAGRADELAHQIKLEEAKLEEQRNTAALNEVKRQLELEAAKEEARNAEHAAQLERLKAVAVPKADQAEAKRPGAKPQRAKRPKATPEAEPPNAKSAAPQEEKLPASAENDLESAFAESADHSEVDAPPNGGRLKAESTVKLIEIQQDPSGCFTTVDQARAIKQGNLELVNMLNELTSITKQLAIYKTQSKKAGNTLDPKELKRLTPDPANFNKRAKQISQDQQFGLHANSLPGLVDKLSKSEGFELSFSNLIMQPQMADTNAFQLAAAFIPEEKRSSCVVTVSGEYRDLFNGGGPNNGLQFKDSPAHIIPSTHVASKHKWWMPHPGGGSPINSLVHAGMRGKDGDDCNEKAIKSFPIVTRKFGDPKALRVFQMQRFVFAASRDCGNEACGTECQTLSHAFIYEVDASKALEAAPNLVERINTGQMSSEAAQIELSKINFRHISPEEFLTQVLTNMIPRDASIIIRSSKKVGESYGIKAAHIWIPMGDAVKQTNVAAKRRIASNKGKSKKDNDKIRVRHTPSHPAAVNHAAAAADIEEY